LDLVPYLLLLFAFIVKGIGIGQVGFGDFIDSYNMYVDVPRWISITVYTWQAFKIIRKLSNKTTNAYRWSYQLILAFAVFQLIWLVFLVPYLIPGLSAYILSAFGWYPVYVPLTILVYWLGIKGFTVGAIIRAKPSDLTIVDEQHIDGIIQQLKFAMQSDKLFLNPALNLNDLVVYTNSTQKNISAILNQHMGKSFNEFINEYRVSEVKRKLLENENQHFTLTGVALASGFNSQATFQRAFKAITNQTPGQYLKSVRENTDL